MICFQSVKPSLPCYKSLILLRFLIIIYRDLSYAFESLRLLPVCGEIGRQRSTDTTFKYLINYFENQKSADIQNLFVIILHYNSIAQMALEIT